jgi:MFS family permease
MAIFPKIEKITLDATISHFLLMFGYKLFSLYFPLFLIVRGFSFPQVGYTYLLIYLPLALFAPIVGFFSHKISPVILAALGIFGYGIYCLGMILVHPVQFPILFYFFQIFLGISAALFFVSMRGSLIAAPLKNHNQAFAWFYSAPYYATAIAPVLGAVLIWKFNFFGVFAFSLALQFLNAVFLVARSRKNIFNFFDKASPGLERKFIENYRAVFQKLKKRSILIPILVAFSVLLLGGFYRAFFVLFLKDLGWTQNLILFFVSLLSLVFLPISFFIIKRIGKLKSEKNIFQGAAISGLFSIVLGGLGAFAGFATIFFVKITQAVGGLMCGSGRSGLISQKLKDHPQEAGALDTIFSPLGAALGSLIAGLIIGFLGFGSLFILGGIFVFLVVIFSYFDILKNRKK